MADAVSDNAEESESPIDTELVSNPSTPLRKMMLKHRANSLKSLANNPIDLMRIYAGGVVGDSKEMEYS